MFHKYKYITNTDVTPEDRVITAMDKLSQELRGNPPEHLSDTTLEQLTTFGNILKLKSADKYECGLTELHRLPTPPLFLRPYVPPLTPPRVPTGTEIPSPPPKVKPSRRLPADVVPENRIGYEVPPTVPNPHVSFQPKIPATPPRVEPPRRSAILADLVRQEE